MPLREAFVTPPGGTEICDLRIGVEVAGKKYGVGYFDVRAFNGQAVACAEQLRDRPTEQEFRCRATLLNIDLSGGTCFSAEARLCSCRGVVMPHVRGCYHRGRWVRPHYRRPAGSTSVGAVFVALLILYLLARSQGMLS